MEGILASWAVWDEWMKDCPDKPGASLVGVAMLFSPEALVEVEVTAVAQERGQRIITNVPENRRGTVITGAYLTLKETERRWNRRPIPSRQVIVGFRLSVAVDRSQQEMERYMGLFRSEKVRDRGSDMAGLFWGKAGGVCGCSVR
eukprot:scaffold1602_cov151-Amphora_coffeaeformis.AAC.8